MWVALYFTERVLALY